MRMTMSHQRSNGARRCDGPPSGRAGERGVVLVVGALMMVGLLVISGLVVDMGGVYSARRRDQASADAGALAAAQNLSSRSAAAASAIEYAEEDLGVDLPDAAWNSCSIDAGALPVRATGRNCISFSSANSRIRVRIPDQYHETAFGGVIGKGKVRHSAFAIAGVAQRGFGGVLPFGMPAGASGGDGYACVKSNSGGQSEAPCNGPDSGNFGTIDIGLYGNEDLGTKLSCGSGEARTLRIPNNIAVGSDHQLGTYTGSNQVIDAPDGCNAQTPVPNSANTETGNLSDAVEFGFIRGGAGDFSDPGPARLRRTDDGLFDGLVDGQGRQRKVRGNLVDDNGLWTFIPPDLTGDVPASCLRNQFVDGNSNPFVDGDPNPNLPEQVRIHVSRMSLQDRMLALLTRCMTHYSGEAWGGGGEAGLPAMKPVEQRTGCVEAPGVACTGAVFSLNTTTADSPDLYDIQYTPRFAYVPELTTREFPSGNGTIHFNGFRAVYIQRLVLGTGTDAQRFDPGISFTELNPSGNGIREVTLWAFTPSMLPNGLGDSQAAYEIGKNRFVTLVR